VVLVDTISHSVNFLLNVEGLIEVEILSRLL
jgi:hypothetical protein